MLSVILFSRVPLRLIAVVAVASVGAQSFAIYATTSKTNAGAVDTTYASVGMFSNASGALVGSGVAIGTHQVLTAGHVFGPTFTLNGTSYNVISSIMAPNVDGNAVDLRIVTVSGTLSNIASLGTSADVNSGITMVGLGRTGVVASDGLGYTGSAIGERHAGDNTIDGKGAQDGLGPYMLSYLDHAGNAALGAFDSGGGWFQNGKLVGISSFTFNDTQPDDIDAPKYRNYGFSAANTSGYNSAVDSPNYSGPAYSFGANEAYFGSGAIDITNPQLHAFVVQTVPEPAPCLALGAGALMLLRRRRR